MRKKLLVGLIAVALLLAGGVVYVSAEEGFLKKGPDNAITEAIAAGDYDSWKNLMIERFSAGLTEEHFNKMVEIHQLMEEGKYDEAKALRQELGMDKLGKHRGKKARKMFSMTEEGQLARQALENHDYQAWKDAVGDRQITEIINQDNFDKFVEFTQLIHDGKFEEAKPIAEELGLPAKR